MRARAIIALALAGLAAVPAGARGQATPASFAGGSPALPGTGGAVAVTLQPRGDDRVVVRFETTLRCGADRVEVTARGEGPVEGLGFTVRGATVRELATGRPLRAAWTVAGGAVNGGDAGTVAVAGVRRGGTRCRAVADRIWQAQLVHAPEPPFVPAAAQPLATMAGGSTQVLTDELAAPLVLRVDAGARSATVRFTAAAACARGPRRIVPVEMPAVAVRGDALAGRRRATVRGASTALRSTADLAGRFTSDAVTGTLRVRVSGRDARGRPVRCDSGTQPWVAWTTPGPAYFAAGPGTPVPDPLTMPLQRGTWSLRMTSDPNDFIGAGQPLSFAPPALLQLVPDRRHVEFFIQAGQLDWSGAFAAPPGAALHRGTYGGAMRWPFNETAPGLDVDGDHRGCNTVTGTFTIDRLAFAGYALRDFVVRFEQHCEGGADALRGTFSWHAT